MGGTKRKLELTADEPEIRSKKREVNRKSKEKFRGTNEKGAEPKEKANIGGRKHHVWTAESRAANAETRRRRIGMTPEEVAADKREVKRKQSQKWKNAHRVEMQEKQRKRYKENPDYRRVMLEKAKIYYARERAEEIEIKEKKTSKSYATMTPVQKEAIERRAEKIEKRKKYRGKPYAAKTSAQKAAILERNRINRKNWTDKQRRKRNAYMRNWRGQRVVCQYCRKTVITSYLTRHEALHRRRQALMNSLTPEEHAQIEKETREGPLSERWKAHRWNRITGSEKAHDVLVCFRKKKDMLTLAPAYHCGISNFTSKAMRMGVDLEPDALDAYQRHFQIPDGRIQKKVGLCVYTKAGFLAATPDAKVTLANGQKGVVEVKYTGKTPETVGYLMRMTSRVWKPGHKGKYLGKPKNLQPTLQLSRGFKYFTQVVMEIMCADVDFCDFIVYNQNKTNPNQLDLWHERISRSEAEKYWVKWYPQFKHFYETVLAIKDPNK